MHLSAVLLQEPAPDTWSDITYKHFWNLAEHVATLPAHQWVQRLLSWHPFAARGVGRPRHTWESKVSGVSQARGSWILTCVQGVDESRTEENQFDFFQLCGAGAGGGEWWVWGGREDELGRGYNTAERRILMRRKMTSSMRMWGWWSWWRCEAHEDQEDESNP